MQSTTCDSRRAVSASSSPALAAMSLGPRWVTLLPPRSRKPCSNINHSYGITRFVKEQRRPGRRAQAAAAQQPEALQQRHFQIATTVKVPEVAGPQVHHLGAAKQPEALQRHRFV